MSESNDRLKFAVVDGDGEPMWQFADDMEHAEQLLRLMQARHPDNGPWTIVSVTDLITITDVDGLPKWVMPQKFWN